MTGAQIRIGIVGGGIGGLTLALALRQRGLAADVYEQASELREIGAAVGLTANGTRELERLGCLDDIAALSAEPSELIWREWREGNRVAAFPIAQGGAYRARFGAPFIGIHRADLQRVLGATHGTERLHLGHRLVALSEKDDVVKLDFANGNSAEVDVLVGAERNVGPSPRKIWLDTCVRRTWRRDFTVNDFADAGNRSLFLIMSDINLPAGAPQTSSKQPMH
jgi:salicylate hydroxylase